MFKRIMLWIRSLFEHNYHVPSGFQIVTDSTRVASAQFQLTFAIDTIDMPDGTVGIRLSGMALEAADATAQVVIEKNPPETLRNLASAFGLIGSIILCNTEPMVQKKVLNNDQDVPKLLN